MGTGLAGDKKLNNQRVKQIRLGMNVWLTFPHSLDTLYPSRFILQILYSTFPRVSVPTSVQIDNNTATHIQDFKAFMLRGGVIFSDKTRWVVGEGRTQGLSGWHASST